MTYCYLRVSTDRQEARSQRVGIERFLLATGREPDDCAWETDEGAGGGVDWRQRRIGRILMEKARKGDVIVVSEVSRLARSLQQVTEIAALCRARGVGLEVVKERFSLPVEGVSPVADALANMQLANMQLAMLASVAELERALLRERTREGLERAARDGKHLGRPKGSKKKHPLLEGQEGRILKMLRRGKSFAAIARRLKCHSVTVRLKVHGTPELEAAWKKASGFEISDGLIA